MGSQPGTGKTLSYFFGLVGVFIVQGALDPWWPKDKREFTFLVECPGGQEDVLLAAATRFARRRGGDAQRTLTGLPLPSIRVALPRRGQDCEITYLERCSALSRALMNAVQSKS